MKNVYKLSGIDKGHRIESRVLEEQIQQAVASGERNLEIDAAGQHGLGGRLWSAGDEPVNITITGSPGQRLGSMGFPNTRITVKGPASDDTGWLNAGAEIAVLGHATNGTANAMAQGKVFIGGNIGSRGMTMTKANPRFAPPELWVLGSVGDYFAEFMAGGVAVVCGYDPQNPENVLGYRPCVGMVRGQVFVRGPFKGFSQADASLVPIDEETQDWLFTNLKNFLERIEKPELYDKLARIEDWQLIVAKTPMQKSATPRMSMKDFAKNVWESELGAGGLVGDLVKVERDPIPVVATGEFRRFVPVWEDQVYASPCQSSCPSGIPVQQRWAMIREGRVDEAVDMALNFTPFPATVCGYLCPNLCMQACTRNLSGMAPIDVKVLGKASINASLPELPPLSGKKVAVIGGGVAGISAAWQLRMAGHEAVIYDMEKKLGGKMSSVIPNTRIPKEVIDKELERMAEALPHVQLEKKLDQADVAKLREEHEFVVVAAGAGKPKMPPLPGIENAATAMDFLGKAKAGDVKPGKSVVIIGAGNVGCDVATEAHRLGATEITLIDVQKPASFGEERKAAEEAGATFLWPVFTKEITGKGVALTNGDFLDADTVVVAIGDAPDTAFLPETVKTVRGFVEVDENFQTTDSKFFAIGDIVMPGLLTDAIGAGRRAAMAITAILEGKRPEALEKPQIDKTRVSMGYFNPRVREFEEVNTCAMDCSSCGTCRDCGICEAICPQAAITRVEEPGKRFEMVVDPEKCIGCGFCAGACPCGIWTLVENDPMG
ncbi:FAD-dependent oxidoreductase [Desulfatibacillum aliphaticivorans]|uniref:FAD-dependent oxidoreductase n=1 Tax=Desulfatibacillum aliphaticivorans TaxID=218208 RepID=UPI0004164B31|nr:FAD-dependent oxidoreductase [Desulfatibacillum aliphaticivorans]